MIRGTFFALCTIAFLGTPNTTAALGTPHTVRVTDGESLLSICKSYDPEHTGVCDGYIQGVISGTQLTNFLKRQPFSLCFPSGVRDQQLRDLVIRDLDRHPISRWLNAALLVINSLETAFPCESRQ